jgi:tRNA A-37 threonylcarbamoyl transferase component Bud32
MLRCPFCDADLGGESNRLRSGRCPKCSSILSWDDDESQPEAGPTNLPSLLATLPPARSDDDDAPSIKDIVRTIVQRGAPSPPSISATVNLGNTPLVKRPPPPLPRPVSAEADAPPPPISQPLPSEIAGDAPELQKMWKGSLTVASKPSMTLKAAAAEPDPAISDLLIRPCRIGQPGDAADTGAEYELQEVIGEGGVGVVYAARQASIDRTVALKVLRDEFAHKRDHRNKFLSEAVVTGELDHPNIVPIYDLGTSDLGNLFYAMKRVRGTPWSDVVRQQALAENLRILMSVADAIAFAHSRGVIHRDLKPENVMLGDFGEVLVMDWGIALSTNMFVKSDHICNRRAWAERRPTWPRRWRPGRSTASARRATFICSGRCCLRSSPAAHHTPART